MKLEKTVKTSSPLYIIIKSFFLPYSGCRNKGPPESMPRTFEKRTWKLFTVPIRILNISKIKRKVES